MSVVSACNSLQGGHFKVRFVHLPLGLASPSDVKKLKDLAKKGGNAEGDPLETCEIWETSLKIARKNQVFLPVKRFFFRELEGCEESEVEKLLRSVPLRVELLNLECPWGEQLLGEARIPAEEVGWGGGRRDQNRRLRRKRRKAISMNLKSESDVEGSREVEGRFQVLERKISFSSLIPEQKLFHDKCGEATIQLTLAALKEPRRGACATERTGVQPRPERWMEQSARQSESPNLCGVPLGGVLIESSMPSEMVEADALELSGENQNAQRRKHEKEPLGAMDQEKEVENITNRSSEADKKKSEVNLLVSSSISSVASLSIPPNPLPRDVWGGGEEEGGDGGIEGECTWKKMEERGESYYEVEASRKKEQRPRHSKERNLFAEKLEGEALQIALRFAEWKRHSEEVFNRELDVYLEGLRGDLEGEEEIQEMQRATQLLAMKKRMLSLTKKAKADLAKCEEEERRVQKREMDLQVKGREVRAGIKMRADSRQDEQAVQIATFKRDMEALRQEELTLSQEKHRLVDEVFQVMHETKKIESENERLQQELEEAKEKMSLKLLTDPGEATQEYESQDRVTARVNPEGPASKEEILNDDVATAEMLYRRRTSLLTSGDYNEDDQVIVALDRAIVLATNHPSSSLRA